MNLVTNNKWIGQRTIRPDGMDKVTGRAQFAADTTMPGMIWGKVLRSPHPHARIRAIDVSKARALPGVKAVLTHENCQVVWGAGSIAGCQQYNDEVKKITKHRRPAFNNPVHFVGEPVAAVAAVKRHVAEKTPRLRYFCPFASSLRSRRTSSGPVSVPFFRQWMVYCFPFSVRV